MLFRSVLDGVDVRELGDSQLAAVEPPLPAERVIVVDDGNPPAEVVREIIRRLGLERRT